MSPADGEKDLAQSLAETAKKAEDASHFLKTLANETRLLILCHLASGERSVSELEQVLAIRQPLVSQQLARLRADNLVRHRRSGKAIYYSLANDDVRRVVEAVHGLFCRPEENAKTIGGARPASGDAASPSQSRPSGA
jgi:DNA-binding transcriptional ArsR family regulator